MVRIDDATHDDLPLVQDLARRIWHRHYPGIITAAQIEYMLERGYATSELARFLATAGAGLVIARDDTTPLGFAAWYRPEVLATTKLDKLYVLPDRHRGGIGRRLIEHVENAARRDGSTTLLLNVAKRNTPSIAFYERCGFVAREDVVIDIGGGFVMDDHVMAKAL